MPTDSGSSGNLWLTFALMTVASWGLYGIFLHSGQMAMSDPQQGRYKAFLWVGIAYVLIAVIGPSVMLMKGGTDWVMPSKGIMLSLIAGVLGAVGAFTVLLAFGAGGKPTYVMSIVFAGAPVVNATVGLALHPPPGGFGSLDKRFILGLVLAIVGAALVSLYKPGPGKPPTAPTAKASQE
jgi:uncharacterized membrane protein YeaQ/YmgE (transglycosylase-associated protein family)